jgi:hypothetical protein
MAPVLDEKFSEDELKQLVAWLESPTAKKFNESAPVLLEAMQQKLVADTRGTSRAQDPHAGKHAAQEAGPACRSPAGPGGLGRQARQEVNLSCSSPPLTRMSTPHRPYNFSAGPAVLPEEVLRQAAEEMLDWHGSGMSVMEMSHRGKEFISIYEDAERTVRACCRCPRTSASCSCRAAAWARTPSCR